MLFGRGIEFAAASNPSLSVSEAARGVHVRDVDVVGKRAAAEFGAKLADHTERLVESDQHA